MGEGVAAVPRCVGPRLEPIHVSDKTRRLDRHNVVGFGGVDFAALRPMLAEIGHAVGPPLQVISRNLIETLPTVRHGRP